MFFVESGDHGKFTDLSPNHPAVIRSGHLPFIFCLALATPAQLYNSCSHQENVLKILFLVMIRV